MKSANITQLNAIAELVCTKQVDNVDDYITAEQFAEHKKMSYSGAFTLLKRGYEEGKLDRIKLRTSEDKLRYHYKLSDKTNTN